MIDRESRTRLATALRKLASGLITNDEFDDGAYEPSLISPSNDPVLADLATYGWLHYSDMREYRLRGRDALSREERRSIARAILFLKTDQEYVHGDSIRSCTTMDWPWVRGFFIVVALALLAGALTQLAVSTFLLGFIGVIMLAYISMALFFAVARRLRRRSEQATAVLEVSFWPYLDDRASMEHYRYWPFANRHAYELALADPPFLCGRRLRPVESLTPPSAAADDSIPSDRGQVGD